MSNLTKDEAKAIVRELLTKANGRFKQELEGENEEFLDRVLRQHRARIARVSWKASQKWSKWNDDGPVLMPDYTRIYYRKGLTEVILQEFPPQVRLLKFKGTLSHRGDSSEVATSSEVHGVHHFSLALPYVIFLFKFTSGLFTEVRCAFSDRPLKRLEEKPLRPYLSNLDSNLSVCLGASFDRHQLQANNITQQSALVLSHFWHSVFSDEWSSHYWATKGHFQQNDERLSTLQRWQEVSRENPLFVVDDVNWLPHIEENFGDIIVRLFEDDRENSNFHEELYDDLVNEFLADVKKTFTENIDSVGEKAIESSVDSLADELLVRVDLTK